MINISKGDILLVIIVLWFIMGIYIGIFGYQESKKREREIASRANQVTWELDLQARILKLERLVQNLEQTCR